MPPTKSSADEPIGSPPFQVDLSAPSLGLGFIPPTEPTPPPSRLAYTPAEVAHQLNLGRSKTLALIADGSIPSVKIGRARRILHTDLVEYIESLR